MCAQCVCACICMPCYICGGQRTALHSFSAGVQVPLHSKVPLAVEHLTDLIVINFAAKTM